MAKKKTMAKPAPVEVTEESHFFRAGDPAWLDNGEIFSDGTPMPVAVWVKSVNNEKGTALIGYYEPQGTMNEKSALVEMSRLRHREIY